MATDVEKVRTRENATHTVQFISGATMGKMPCHIIKKAGRRMIVLVFGINSDGSGRRLDVIAHRVKPRPLEQAVEAAEKDSSEILSDLAELLRSKKENAK